MDKNFVNILQQMVAKETKEAILNPTKCKALIKDYARGEFKKEIRWLLTALEEKVQIAINEANDIPNCKLRQIRVLKDECGFADDIAIDIVDMLCFVLRGDTNKSIKATRKKEEPPVKQPTVQSVQNDTIIVKPKEKSIITFGAYQWLVLEEQNDKALLLCKDIIEKRKYHETFELITWDKCNLRAFLNGSFYNSNSFTNADRNSIIHVNNVNENNQWFGTHGGTNTYDRIFLLSISENVKYFGDSGQLAKRPKSDSYLIDDQYNSERIAKFNSWTCDWWLRSPGKLGYFASLVMQRGIISVGADEGLIDFNKGVRPALWLKL